MWGLSASPRAARPPRGGAVWALPGLSAGRRGKKRQDVAELR